MGIVEYACLTSTGALIVALWLEYRDKCMCIRRRTNPYELIDLQKEMRKREENESR